MEPAISYVVALLWRTRTLHCEQNNVKQKVTLNYLRDLMKNDLNYLKLFFVGMCILDNTYISYTTSIIMLFLI